VIGEAGELVPTVNKLETSSSNCALLLGLSLSLNDVVTGVVDAGREGSADERADARASRALRSSANFNRFCSISAIVWMQLQSI
jgi:hypothetical protein